MSTATFNKFSVITILFSLVLTPTIKIPGLIGFRLEEVYLIFFSVIVLFLPNENGWIFKIPLRVILLLAFLPIMLLSMFSGSILLLPATLGDLSKLVWLFKAVIIYLICFNYINQDEQDRHFKIDLVLRCFIKFALISSLICFQQYFDIFGINSLYVPIVAPTQFDTLMPGYPSPRVVGMLGNPNVQGYVLSLAIVAFIYLYFVGRDRISIVKLCILFVAQMMTLSRGALVALLVGSVSLFVMYKKDFRFSLFKILLVIALLFSFYYAYQFMLENEAVYNAMLFRFELLENATEDVSFVARYNAWINNWNYFKLNPLLGVGLLPRETNIGADNEWLHLLRSFGIIGVVWLVILLLIPLFLRRNPSIENKNLTRFILSLLLLSGTFMIPAAVILSPVTFPILLVLLSFSDRSVATVSHMVEEKINN